MRSEDTQNSRAGRNLALSGLALVVGLFVAATVSRMTGGVVVLASWAYFVFALHRYGRTGKSRDERDLREGD